MIYPREVDRINALYRDACAHNEGMDRSLIVPGGHDAPWPARIIRGLPWRDRLRIWWEMRFRGPPQ
jgi:hypothetical protein